jgi:c-di-GMP-binding flagellar brake protein YcgR
MFQDTRPAQLSGNGHSDAWAEFRVDHPREVMALMRQLRDGNVPVNLNSPDGAMLSTSLWALDDQRGRLNFSADTLQPQLEQLVAGNEAVAVAYLDSVKLQFDLNGLLLVRSARASALQAEVPSEVYRFQRRGAFRVRTLEQHAPTARFRHPGIPDMALELRVLDVSAGGCALFMPHDVPPLPPGCRIAQAQIELDADTRFPTALQLQHVTAILPNDRGARLGCEWPPLEGHAARALQRYIDQTQKRRRLLTLG